MTVKRIRKRRAAADNLEGANQHPWSPLPKKRNCDAPASDGSPVHTKFGSSACPADSLNHRPECLCLVHLQKRSCVPIHVETITVTQSLSVFCTELAASKVRILFIRMAKLQRLYKESSALYARCEVLMPCRNVHVMRIGNPPPSAGTSPSSGSNTGPPEMRIRIGVSSRIRKLFAEARELLELASGCRIKLHVHFADTRFDFDESDDSEMHSGGPAEMNSDILMKNPEIAPTCDDGPGSSSLVRYGMFGSGLASVFGQKSPSEPEGVDEQPSMELLIAQQAQKPSMPLLYSLDPSAPVTEGMPISRGKVHRTAGLESNIKPDDACSPAHGSPLYSYNSYDTAPIPTDCGPAFEQPRHSAMYQADYTHSSQQGQPGYDHAQLLSAHAASAADNLRALVRQGGHNVLEDVRADMACFCPNHSNGPNSVSVLSCQFGDQYDQYRHNCVYPSNAASTLHDGSGGDSCSEQSDDYSDHQHSYHRHDPMYTNNAASEMHAGVGGDCYSEYSDNHANQSPSPPNHHIQDLTQQCQGTAEYQHVGSYQPLKSQRYSFIQPKIEPNSSWAISVHPNLLARRVDAQYGISN